MILEDLFNIAVYTQPFIWLGLYNYKRYHYVDHFLLYVAGLFAALLVAFTNFRIGHYPPDILAQYCIMVAFVAYVNRRLPGVRPMCLAFLIVFMNSWIWEFPIHVLDLYENHSVGLQVIQALHLTPLLFYSRITEIDWRQAFVKNIDLFVLCWSFTLGAAYLRTLGAAPYDNYLMHLNRYATLLVCLKTFSAYDPTIPKNNI